MTDKSTADKVTQALFAAIIPVINETRQSGDSDAVNKLGPTLLTAGIMLLLDQTGKAGAATVVEELARRIERGDFDNTVGFFDRFLQ
jgi:hypothetical protein